MPELTGLDTIALFDTSLRSKLADYWITSAEEFVSTARSGNQQLGSGMAALGAVLDLPEQRMRELVQAAQAALPPGVSFSTGVPGNLGTGAIFEGMEVPPPPSFSLPIELPEAVELAGDLPPPQLQGERFTCVAFTLIAMYQHATGDRSDLSEQFLYWACKERDGIPSIRGTRPDVGLAVLHDLGVCEEAIWPYVADQQATEGQGPPPPTAAQEARRRRIARFSSLTPTDVRQIKAALAAGKAVLIGLPIHEHWVESWQSATLGKVRQPLPGEAPMGGHALCAVGYRDDPTAPGKGYFIVRNSWGTSWGSKNSDGPGYGHVPYQLVFEQNIAAFVIDDATLGTPATEAQPAEIPTIQSLHSQAQEIQQRLNQLVEQLAVLAQRNTDRS